jgi:hypothetical protein
LLPSHPAQINIEGAENVFSLLSSFSTVFQITITGGWFITTKKAGFNTGLFDQPKPKLNQKPNMIKLT